MFSLLNAEEKMEFYKRYHEYYEGQVISEYLREVTKKNNRILQSRKNGLVCYKGERGWMLIFKKMI